MLPIGARLRGRRAVLRTTVWYRLQALRARQGPRVRPGRPAPRVPRARREQQVRPGQQARRVRRVPQGQRERPGQQARRVPRERRRRSR